MRRDVWILLVVIIVSSPLTAQEPLSLATWNVRILSDNSRDDQELEQIASILSRYEFVALQEVRDTIVLDRLVALLPDYAYIASPPVGRGVSERYAFFYHTGRIDVTAEPTLAPDPDDIFIREPFVGHFAADSFDFSIVSVHIIYGDSITQRRTEVSALAEILMAVDTANGSEADILLVGDFNLPPDDQAWDLPTYRPLVPPDMPTTITDRSSYDNIWFRPATTHEIFADIEIYLFDELLFTNNDRAASLAVSDHRPVRARFSTVEDDD
jgi:endonuclease/exonuclease/phosphatase family metal-dependent hydrolase